MYPYQQQHIYDPVINELTNQVNDKMKMLALATSAGKTHTLTRHVIPDIIGNGLADIIIFTTPNSASMGEVNSAIKDSVGNNIAVVCEPGFSGGNVPIQLALQPTVIVCHPTWVSQNRDVLKQLSNAKRIVGFCDEAHIGFQADGVEEAIIAYGRSCTYYPAEWNNAVQDIAYKAWFLITATPRNTVEGSDYMEILSECFDLPVLANSQKRVRKIVFNRYDYMDSLRIPEHDYDELVDYNDANTWFANGINIVEELSEKYNLPKVKKSAIFQGKGTDNCLDIWYNVGANSPRMSTAISISERKKIYNSQSVRATARYLGLEDKDTPNANDIVNGINDPNKAVNRLVANHNVGNAINLPGATILYTEKDNRSIRDVTVTQGVEQLLGRMLRWPSVEGLACWDDVAVFRQEKIDEGVPEKDIDCWIDLVFAYTVVLPWSPVNKAGVNAFLRKHTYGFDDWDQYVQGKYELAREGKLTKSKRRSLGQKSPWSQPGDLKYRLNKGEYCEVCPPIPGVGSDLPACAYVHFELKGMSVKAYLEQLDVHHVDGHHENDDPENSVTYCANHHRAVTCEEGHAVNVKYRGKN